MSNVTSGEWFGHPKGLYILFFTELWERFSFYGMKALLILYMVNYLVWEQEPASHVMAWYAGLVYTTPLLGGLLADRLIGARWSVVIGGVLMAIGHFLLAFEPLVCFFSGLGFLIAGCGMLKPNISTQVGSLYYPDDARRDSAFTIFYMGINIGALLGPIVCSHLMEHPGLGFHYGFAAAGVGMVLGLIIYLWGMGSVVRRTAEVAAGSDTAPPDQSAGGSAETVPAATETPYHVARDRVIVLLVIFVFAIVFWMAFEQAANVLTIWADKHTNLYPFRSTAPQAVVGPTAASAPAGRGWAAFHVTASDLLSVNPFFIITLAAVFAWLWIWLERRKLQPSTPVKMVLGLLGMTLAYTAILGAARSENRPSSAPLAAVPPGVKLEKYGATRLRYDPPGHQLRMNGVLTELDWLRALGDSAPQSYRDAVDKLAHEAEQKSRQAREAERWEVRVTLPADVRTLHPVTPLPDSVHWDAQTRTLSATRALPERELLALRAAGADQPFQAALSSIYRQSSTYKVSLWWLVLFYLLCTMGELCLSPVGLSMVTKMAPPNWVGLFMGLWFLTTGGVANFLAHFIGGEWGTMTPIDYFMMFGVLVLGATVLLVFLARLLKRMMHGIQ